MFFRSASTNESIYRLNAFADTKRKILIASENVIARNAFFSRFIVRFASKFSAEEVKLLHFTFITPFSPFRLPIIEILEAARAGTPADSNTNR